MADEERRIDITTLGEDFLNHFYPDNWAREEMPGTSVYAIDKDKIDDLAGNILFFIAEVVAQILDAGSEREAVGENEDLYEEIRKELKGWTIDQ